MRTYRDYYGNHLAVRRERDFSYAINVSRIIHIIIGFYSEPYFSPCLDFSSDCLFPVFRRDGFYLKLLALPFTTPFPSMGTICIPWILGGRVSVIRSEK